MKDSYIGIMVDDGPGQLAGLLGILKSGNSFVPINPVFPIGRVHFIIRDCSIRALLTDSANYEKARQIAEDNPSIDHLLFLNDPDLIVEDTRGTISIIDNKEKVEISLERGESEDPPDPNAYCYVIYTSGSTGRPKGVPITHRNLLPLFSWFRDYFGLGEHTRVMQNLSYTFDFGVFEILTTLLFGGCLFVLNKQTIGDFTTYTHYINKHKINTLHTTPVFFSNIANSGKKMPFVKLLHLGGERLTGKIIQNAAKVVSNDCFIYNGYGPTEATINCSILALTARKGASIEESANIPIGRPSAANEIYILDKYNHAQPIGAAGELCVSGGGLAPGYLNRPELTAEKFNQDLQDYQDKKIKQKFFGGSRGAIFQKSPPGGRRLYRTGDLARWLPDGDIQFLGRIDHQVKIRGYRIELGEVESRLAAHDKIQEAVVVVRENLDRSKFLCAYIVMEPGQTSLIVSELKEYLLQELPGYMAPSFFIQIERMPLTPTGKIDRKALPEPRENFLETGGEYVPPVTGVEKSLVGIWENLLPVERIGVTDDFFDLGGDSILAGQCIARIREEFQVEISLRKFFEQPIIKALLREIDREEGQAITITPAERGKGDEIPLSFAQEQIWFLQQLDKNSMAYHVPRVIRLYGELHVSLLEQTFTEIIRRHEILRTVFPTVEGRPRQQIHPPFPFKLPVIDFSSFSSDEQGEKISQWLREEGQRRFDFEKGPMMRLTLLKLKEKENILVLTEHHLIHDGWTMGVFLGEFIATFSAYAEGRKPRLPELPIQYADFAIWQRNYLQGEVLELHLNYWRKKLAGLSPVSDLPTDRPRPSVISGRGAMRELIISETLSHSLKKLSIQKGVTLFMTMLAAFKVLLYRYTGSEDICIGTGIANRKHKEMEGMLGMVINTLALRTQFRGAMTFEEFLAQVKTTCLEAYEHEDTPFEKVVEAVQPERSLSHTPIFQVLFSFMDIPTENFELPDLEVQVEGAHNRSSKFDINIVVVPPQGQRIGVEGDEIVVEWEYNTDIFDETTALRMMNHYKYLLETVVTHPGEQLPDLPLLYPSEREQLLYEFNDTRVEYPQDKTIHGLFEEQTARTPDRIAIAAHSTTHMTYKELNEKSNQLARLLREKGVGAGSIVGIMGQRSLEMVVGILGILKAGGVYLPIDADYPGQRKQYMLTDSGANILITEGPIPESVSVGVHIDSCRDEWPIHRVRESGRDKSAIRPYMIDAESIAYIMYTSGSTGQPKGVMVTHKNVVRLVKNTNYVALGEETRILQTGAPVFDATTFEIWGSLLNGGQLVLTDKEVILDAHGLADALKDYHINTLWLSAPLFNQLIQQNIELFEPLDYLLVGGDVLSPPHINQVKQRFPGLKVINGYGPTENTTFSTTYLIEKEFEQAIPIGSPIANSTTYIVDRHNQVQPIGVWGELVVGGDGVSSGYLNSPELTAKRFDQDLQDYQDKNKTKVLRGVQGGGFSKEPPWPPEASIYKTGDLARWLGDGTIEFKGRMDKQVKIRGFRIELGEIENHLLTHEAIKEAVVIDRQNQMEKYLCAYIVPISNPAPGAAELRDHLSAGLPDYMIPSFFIHMDRTPLTPNGKIDRKLLPKPDAVFTGITFDYTAPRDTVEEKLAEIWSEILIGKSKATIGIDDNFFDLGGHSLKVTLLVSKIHKEFKIKIPLIEVFKNPIIRALSSYILNTSRSIYDDIKPVPVKDYYPQSSTQRRLFFLDRFENIGTSYNMPMVHKIEGNLDKVRLEKAFNTLIQRHEMLRTSFEIIDEKPVQKIHNHVDFEIQEIPIDKEKQEKTIKGEELKEKIDAFMQPFVLGRAPLFRVGRITLSETQSLLLFDMHHIITDGTSQKTFTRELLALYAGEEELPELSIQYKDFSEWQSSDTVKKQIREQEAYWLEEFAGEVPVLNLPIDYPRPDVRSFKGGSVEFDLGKEEIQQLNRLYVTREATLFMMLLAIGNIFLSRLTGQEDIILGIPIAGRRHADLEPIIGMFVNTLALRNCPSGEKTINVFIDEVKEKTLRAYENQEYQFEDLVDRVAVNRDMSRNPLFDVMIVLQNQLEQTDRLETMETAQLKVTPYRYERTTAKFDMIFHIFETEEQLTFGLEYSTDLFKPGTIRRFINYFKTIVKSIIRDPGQRISDIEIISEEEKKQVLVDFNNTGTGYPRDKTIHELFREQAESTPGCIAVIGKGAIPAATRFAVSTTDTMQVTYGELNEKSNQLARVLMDKGVISHDIVAIMVEPSIEMIIGILGILKAGGSYLPIDPDYPGERKRYILSDSKTRILMTARNLSEGTVFEKEIIYLENYKKTAASLGSSFHAPCSMRHAGPPGSSSLAYIIYTSGSTGRPKGVIVRHRSLVNLCIWHNRYYGVTAADNATQFASFGFDAAVWEIFPYLIKGASLHIISREMKLDINRLNRYYERHDITISFLPTQLCEQFMFMEEENRSLRSLLTGGDKLRRFREREYNLFNNYGPTENSVVTSCCPVDEYAPNIPIGKPIHNNKIYILSKDHSHAQPIGVPGELCISGDSLAAGYLNNPEITAENFIPNPCEQGERLYCSGDVGRWVMDGNIQYLGRVDQQVKIRGFRIELGEIENRLLSHQHIKEAVVINRAEAHGETGKENGDGYLCAYIIPHSTAPSNTFTASQLREYLDRELPGYMIPAYFVQMEKIPLNANGKVNRNELPPPTGKIYTEYVAPGSDREKIIAEIWQEVLGVEKVGIHHNFFELGGTSLHIIRISDKLKTVLKEDIPVVNMFRYPTIRSLAASLNKEETDDRLSHKKKKIFDAIDKSKERMKQKRKVKVRSIARRQ